MDKETYNLMEFGSYKDQKPMNHLSRACSDFYADLVYEDDVLETVTLMNTLVRWQHSYENFVMIPDLQPPYYSDFNFRFQNFECQGNILVITGTHHDDPGKRYKITLR